MTQQPLFVPTQQGEQPAEPLQAHLRHRATDPQTSVDGAKKSTQRMGFERGQFLGILNTYGAMTCKEAARYTDNPSHWAFRFNSRVHEWEVAGHIELTGEIRDGGRVWRIRT